MKLIKLYTGPDNKSYFIEIETEMESEQPLGIYSKKYPATGLIFRDFKEGLKFDWHLAPQPQYIVYLEGKIEIEASGGEKRIFYPGDILFVTDVNGEGHVTRTLTRGKTLIITTE